MFSDKCKNLFHFLCQGKNPFAAPNLPLCSAGQMLDSFLVLTRTGLLLWSPEAVSPAVLEAVSALIREQVLPERGIGSPFECGPFTLRCLLRDDQLLFVAVASTVTISYAAYAAPLLRLVSDRWAALYSERARAAGAALVAPGWEKGCEERAGWSCLAAGLASSSSSSEGEPFTAGFGAVYEDLKEHAESAQERRGSGGGSSAQAAPQPESPAAEASPALEEQPQVSSPVAPTGPGGRGLTPVEKARLAEGSGKKPSTKKKEQARTWGDDFGYSEKAASALDRSKKPATPSDSSLAGGGGGSSSSSSSSSSSGGGSSSSSSPLAVDLFPAEKRALAGTDLLASSAPSSSSAAAAASPPTPSWWARATTWLSATTGASLVLTEAHLEPICQQLKATLVERNVSEAVAQQVTASVQARLQGRTLDSSSSSSGGGGGSLSSRLQACVTDALRDSLERILCPTQPVDLLRDAVACKEANAGLAPSARQPYVAVFCGVNGVGKSTSLAKVAFMLKEGGCRVLIAACDSFRSGAVEQLKKHTAALGVELYEQGYQKDPAEIARAGIKRAVQCGADVVLVDTAGRMQNNSTLMRQLARLVGVNRPDMVLFVGEALVGGDGVDQLTEFNRALLENAEPGKAPRGIDGILLTKFDTVDDKVGAALSMVHACNIPIAYLGVGQTYTDIRRLNVGAVLHTLLG
jgi:signal recognition particle receptor subunit alpha